jgi:hypothetical protein
MMCRFYNLWANFTILLNFCMNIMSVESSCFLQTHHIPPYPEQLAGWPFCSLFSSSLLPDWLSEFKIAVHLLFLCPLLQFRWMCVNDALSSDSTIEA